MGRFMLELSNESKPSGKRSLSERAALMRKRGRAVISIAGNFGFRL